jgi:glycosyltransferase involved in cell wall biosynthesis
MHLLPNPLDLSNYEFRLRKRPQPRIVWIRAFHHVYNPLLAAKVVELLARDVPEVELIMVGPDKKDGSLEELKRFIEERGLSDRILLQGGVHKDEVGRWLNQGDIFLNTARIDNTPVSVLESMACGLCVVSSKVGGIPYLLEDEENALLVSSDNPEAMASAVSRILTDNVLSERLSLNAHRKVRNYDWSVILPKWEALLMSIVEGKKI